MTRGNQRDNDRKKALKKQADAKSKNTMTGSQFQRAKEDNASIMRQKQEAGMLITLFLCSPLHIPCDVWGTLIIPPHLVFVLWNCTPLDSQHIWTGAKLHHFS
ncbi:hypothetical protein AWENTII_003989 [Aspergillus wentii]